MRFTLAQMMKLIAFIAAPFACVAFLMQPYGNSTPAWTDLARFLAMMVPIIWAMMSLVVVRKSHARDRLIAAFLLIPMSILIAAVVLAGNYESSARSALSSTTWPQTALLSALSIAYISAFIFLVRRLFR